MKNSDKNTKAIVALDWDLSFSFPTLECVVAVFIFLSVGICLTNQMIDPSISIVHGPEFNGTALSEYYTNLAERGALYSFTTIISISAYIMAFAIPLLLSFSLAASFENGLLETLLSYPISRKNLLLARAGIIVAVMSVSVGLASMLSVSIFFPGLQPVSGVALMIIACIFTCLSITSGSMLLAVVSKRIGMTSAGGAGLWIAVLFMASSSPEYRVIDGIVNPIQLIVRYLNIGGVGVSMLDVSLGLLGALLLGLALLTTSVLVFEKVDI